MAKDRPPRTRFRVIVVGSFRMGMEGGKSLGPPPAKESQGICGRRSVGQEPLPNTCLSSRSESPKGSGCDNKQ